jgi:hypothetical protein
MLSLIYMTDTGLLTAMYGYDMKAAIIQDTLKGPAKGGIYENLIAGIFGRFSLKVSPPALLYRTYFSWH